MAGSSCDPEQAITTGALRSNMAKRKFSSQASQADVSERSRATWSEMNLMAGSRDPKQGKHALEPFGPDRFWPIQMCLSQTTIECFPAHMTRSGKKL